MRPGRWRFTLSEAWMILLPVSLSMLPVESWDFTLLLLCGSWSPLPSSAEGSFDNNWTPENWLETPRQDEGQPRNISILAINIWYCIRENRIVCCSSHRKEYDPTFWSKLIQVVYHTDRTIIKVLALLQHSCAIQTVYYTHDYVFITYDPLSAQGISKVSQMNRRGITCLGDCTASQSEEVRLITKCLNIN